jgi:DNA mismatch repair protein MutS
MFQEYYDLYNTYTQKYGANTAIFLMVGAFYELYEIQNVETGETRCNVKEIADILGFQFSIKKDVEIGCNGLVAGFPEYALHKWAGRLTSDGWTVVIVDQIKDARGKVKERKVSRILSPSTHIENTTSYDTPYVVTLYFQQNTSLHFGAATLDLTTGTTKTHFGVASGNSSIWTANDLVQLLSVYQPKELLIYWKGASVPDMTTFRRIFGIPQIPIHIRAIETGAFSKELYRSEYLQKIYSVKSVLPVRTYLGLRSDMDEMALILLLQFVEEHYPSMLQSFHRNAPWIPEERLICGNHALTQLQMTSQNQNESVIGLFDKSITVMGKRAIRDRLLSPYSDVYEIRARLKEVQEYISWPNEKSHTLEKQLRFMSDLPRLHRKLQCGLITPQEVVGLFQTYSAMQVIMKVTKNTSLEESFSQEKWLQYLNTFQDNFNQEKAQMASNDITIFSEKYKEICQKEKDIKEILDEFQIVKREIAKNGGVNEDAIRLEERDKEPYGLKCSSVTLAQLKKNKLDIKISELKSGGLIDSIKLQQLNTTLQKLREELNNLIKIHLVDECVEISEVEIWYDIEKWVCHIDCTQCIGRTSKERGFCCPTIEQGSSGFDIKSLRHPLVEATSSRVSYIKHDVKLDDVKGWLVYGMNASGKSTLMKATGICILLAQAGCFVPAKEMYLRPFKSIYTRILNQDNIFAGLSSFAVEMSELRDILRNANEYTLVLGDELCSGTESVSAQALVESGIQWLTAKNAKFIFATHLHNLSNITDTDVEVWHLHVEYDPINKKLV